MLPFAHHTLFTLDHDILTLIVELLSVDDARNFRLCSKRADFFASAHALSRQELLLLHHHTVRSVERLLEQQAGRLPLIKCLRLTRKYKYKDLDVETVTAILRLLPKTPNVRELRIEASTDLLNLAPGLLDAVGRLPRLQKLALPGSDTKASNWFLGGGNTPLVNTLTHLKLGLLDLTDGPFGACSPPRLPLLRSLSVETLEGRVVHLVAFAPTLKELIIEKANDVVLPNPSDNTKWTTLTAITGHGDAIHRLLPLFRSSTYAVVFTHTISSETDARCIQPVLQALQPTYLGFAERVDWRLVCEHITSEPQRFTYLRLRVPTKGIPWMSTLNAFGKRFTALRCLDLDMSEAKKATASTKTARNPFGAILARHTAEEGNAGTSARFGSVCLGNEVHYMSRKIPTLRFLLSHGTPGCPPDLFDHPHTLLLGKSCAQPVVDTTRGIVFKAWKKASQFSDWQHGRREANLSEAEAQRVRDAFREGAFGARLLPGGEHIL
ncbi:hypothetical protein EIP86_008002 [Pleurotus ostreatoroseus]|nr:hypothetical protein EIP86_008002 [Pleurotus ostreatoroseus]